MRFDTPSVLLMNLYCHEVIGSDICGCHGSEFEDITSATALQQ
jgi:hypothetical protein